MQRRNSIYKPRPGIFLGLLFSMGYTMADYLLVVKKEKHKKERATLKNNWQLECQKVPIVLLVDQFAAKMNANNWIASLMLFPL